MATGKTNVTGNGGSEREFVNCTVIESTISGSVEFVYCYEGNFSQESYHNGQSFIVDKNSIVLAKSSGKIRAEFTDSDDVIVIQNADAFSGGISACFVNGDFVATITM